MAFEADNEGRNAPVQTIFAANTVNGIIQPIPVIATRVTSARIASFHVTRPRIVITMASAMSSGCVSVTQVTWDSVVKFSVILRLAVNTANVTNTENVCVIRVTMVATVRKNATDMVAASKTNVFATTAILDYSANPNAMARENV